MSIILLGDGAVGKTSIIKMFSEKSFTTSHMVTIGLDYVTTTYKGEKGEDYRVQIWDTAG